MFVAAHLTAGASRVFVPKSARPSVFATFFAGAEKLINYFAQPSLLFVTPPAHKPRLSERRKKKYGRETEEGKRE